MITALSQLDDNKTYSYADYLRWKFEERVELIRGKIAAMSAPSMKHQKISRKINHYLSNALWHTSCELFAAPFDVRLPLFNAKKNSEVITVVQPDICVICDKNKLDTKGCIGAPDLIVEIISPGNSRRELKDKYEIYQEAGVKEYWIVNPLEKTINIYSLNEKGIYIGLQPLVEGDFATTPIIPNLQVDLTEVFAD